MPKRKKSAKFDRHTNSATIADDKTQLCIIDYKQLETSIIYAHNEIQKQEINKQKEQIENDYLTLIIKGLMNTLIIFGLIIASISTITSTIYTYSSALSDNKSKILAWSFWIVFYLFFIILAFTIIKTIKWTKRGNSVLIGIISLLMIYEGISFVISLHYHYGELGAAMLVAIVSGLVILVLAMGKTSLKKEIDRAFIISYFSSIVSFVALIVSVIALFISRKAN